MRTSMHQVAVFEEGFILVGVDFADVRDYGAEKVWQVIQKHQRIQARGVPVVIVYQGEDGRMRAYGDQDLVRAVTSMNFRDINFAQELTLEWSERSDHEVTAQEDERDNANQ